MSERRRVLHLRASNFLGGPERQILGYAAMEHEDALEVIVGAFAGEKEGRELLAAAQQRGLPHKAFPAHSVLAAYAALERYITDEEISLLCTHGYKADIIGLAAARRCGIPVAMFLRGWTGENWKVRLYESLDRVALRWASRSVCLSQNQSRRVAAAGVPRERTRVVVNATEKSETSSSLKQQARREIARRYGVNVTSQLIAWAGRLSPEKGAEYLLRALPQIRVQSPAMHCVVFGDGVLASTLRQSASELGVADAVTFAGHTRDFPNLLCGFDLLVNSSLSEEMPNVVLEAMASGVPVVATAVGGVPEIAGVTPVMVMVPPANVVAIASAVCKLMQDPEAARALAKAGKARVEEEFSRVRQKRQLQSLYDELLQNSPFDEQSEVESSEMQSGEVQIERQCNPVRSQTSEAAALPMISVVLPVRNEGKSLGGVLDALRRQNYPADRYEILVADGESDDNTVAVANEYANVAETPLRVLVNPARLSSSGRNAGIRASRGEIVAFLDGHCHIPSSNLLLDIARLMKVTGADCLCRPQPLSAPSNNWFQRLVAEARSSRIGHGRDSAIYDLVTEGFINPTSSGAVYSSRVFTEIGLYDESFDACEDVELNYRAFKAGLPAYTSPRLAVHYEPRANLIQLFRQMSRYGRGRVRLARKHPRAASFSQILPALLMAALVVGVIAGLWFPAALKLTFLTLFVYALNVLLFSIGAVKTSGWRALIVMPPIFAAIHAGLGWGFVEETIGNLARTAFHHTSFAESQKKEQGPVAAGNSEAVVERN